MANPAATATPAADQAYQEARTAYYALKGDAGRRKLRHHWLNVAHKFEAVAAAHPKSPRAPEALFTSGEMLSELSRISGQASDLEAGVANYTRLVDGHPKHRLADDAGLALARIALERQGDPELARQLLERALSRTREGDQLPAMKKLLASLPAQQPRQAAPELVKALAKASTAPATQAKDASPKATTRAAAAAARSNATGAASAATAPAGSSAPSAAARPAPAAVGASAPAGPSENASPGAGPAHPASRLSDEALAAEVEEVEPSKLPVLERVQEKLRGVRVGEIEPAAPKVDEAQAKARLKQMAKDEKAAEMTFAEQLGLKVRRVVIDAGHGGHDTGAIGAKGTREKDVTLAISTRLAKHLTDSGLEVLLTRDDDTFLKLEDRAKVANLARGDLFISVHCNAAHSSKLRGIETYTLNTSADRYSIRLAARENASSEKGISDLQFILADLATKANTEESSRLAQKVQSSLVSHLSQKHKEVKDLGHKEALFYVLLGAKMPAILVEASFLSNPEEEKLLASAAYQEEVAVAIAQGVQDFLGARQRLARVD